MTPAVNRASWPCRKHEYNHYHEAHCLRSIVGKAKNAELFKEKVLARQLSRHVSVCPRLHTSVPLHVCLHVFCALRAVFTAHDDYTIIMCVYGQRT